LFGAARSSLLPHAATSRNSHGQTRMTRV
jgi:hypothetical protein